jgi:hypothetical protein
MAYTNNKVSLITMISVHRSAGHRACIAFLIVHALPGMTTTLDDIGYTKLQAELGAALPVGAGVIVTQVEANNLSDGGIAYSPDPSHANFSGKTITDVTGLSTAFSTHATSAGRRFFGAPDPNTPGTPVSSAPGITTINSYWADEWLFTDFIRLSQNQQPKSSSSRIANHSWIGRLGNTNSDPMNGEALRRLDWLAEADEFLQVTGFTGNSSNPLLGSAYNVIAVNGTPRQSINGTVNVDSIYHGDRTGLSLVAPHQFASDATPRVASAAALLIEAGHSDTTLSTDPVAIFTANRNGMQIYNAERSEVIKALLMAGADRVTHNSIVADIANYAVAAADRKPNGLDRRYGAGQLNIYNSYRIIAAGEQNSDEDDLGAGGLIDDNGFDYDPSFGGLQGGNSEASYYFAVQENLGVLAASLVWNINIDGGSENNFDPSATLYDLDLHLYDVTDSTNPNLISSSDSNLENTENILASLETGQAYMLRVKVGNGQSAFNWDYALAWHLASDVDADGAPDELDNCTTVPNGPLLTDAGGNVQLDSNGDGYGNACDADLNADGVVNGLDVGPFTAEFGTAGPDADFNGDGVVNGLDVGPFVSSFGQAPGPSALVP